MWSLLPRFLIRLIPLIAFIGSFSIYPGNGRAQGIPFSEEPIQFGGTESRYRSILRDIDLDGDLDLSVLSWDPSPLAHYFNQGSPDLFEQSFVEFLPLIRGHSFTLGDVDNDGDPDVVTGGGSQGAGSSGPNELWLNENGEYQSTPVWVSGSPPENFTAAVQLADVDADGDLDLVCGNGHLYTGSGYANTLYLNEGGVFDTSPSWTSEAQVNNTQTVAIGDLDRDGLLDLVFGNAHQNTLYLNLGSPDLYAQSPDWIETIAVDATVEILLGDVDNDGDLDMISANRSNVKLYLNEHDMGHASVFPDTSAWVTELPVFTSSADLSDVNGDGWLDLVIADVESNNRLFLNQGLPEIFVEIPSWEFESGTRTVQVHFGDVDGDGDLDLVCTNDLAPNSVFINNTQRLTGDPEQPMLLTRPTWSVILGDVDGDDDIDLLCGNDVTSTLYLNDPAFPGYLAPFPDWTSSFSFATRSVALGDIDGDGDLELACGNFGQQNILYLNDGGTFGSVPDWYSAWEEPTACVLLIDVDQNRAPDLVCGNLGAANRIYFNHGTDLDEYSGWSSSESRNTRSITMGDVDADGWLDLVCGNEGQTNTLYLNSEGTFSLHPTWETNDADRTFAVALGDVTGNGYLDLVCGNQGQRNKMYRNTGGQLSEDPSWQSEEADSTTSMILFDVDGDGDLDLVCGNFNGREALYLNVGGRLTESVVWQSLTPYRTTSIVSGDLDRDGDLDLVVGNLDQGNSIHLGLRNPVFTSDPLSPLGHLPNNPTYLEDVNVAAIGDNRYNIQWRALDVESDPYWMLLRYRYEDARHGEGQPLWLPIGDATLLGPYAALPGGSQAAWEWDVSLLPRDHRGVTLRLQVLTNPRSVSRVQYVPFHLTDLGPLAISRPEILVSPSVVFPTVTVGDTVSTVLTVTNSGSEDLIVSAVNVPSTEMWIAGNAQFTVSAGIAHLCTLMLAPCEEMEVGGSVEIISNAPLSPAVIIPVQTQILALDVQTRSLNPEVEVPLGEALTVIVSPEVGVNVEGGHLFHRPTGSATAFRDSIPLAVSGEDFIAVIPGEAVTETGLDYYVKVVNGCVFATDPPGAPADSVFVQTVALPVSVVAAPQPTSGTDFLQWREITVLVSLPPGAEFAQGTLYTRRGGEATYWSQPLQESDPLPVGIVPDSLVGPRGLEFWVEVQTRTSVLTDPGENPANEPHSIQVRVPGLAELDAYPAQRYRMISVPLDFGPDFSGTLESLLADQPEFGPYDPVQWRSFRWLPGEGRYVELSEEPNSDAFYCTPGRGFWLISRDDSRIATAPITGFSTPTDSAYTVVLEPGYNQIGDPFAFPVSWDSVLVDGLTMAEAEGTVVEPLVTWVGDDYQHDVRILEPFGGYWVKNLEQEPIILQIPPREAVPEPPGKLAEGAGPLAFKDEYKDQSNSWQLVIQASSGSARDGFNVFGVRSGAEVQWDRHDRSEPPLSPGQSLSLYFPHPEWDDHPGLYTVDIRDVEVLSKVKLTSTPEDDACGHVWRFDVAKSFADEGAGDRVRLEFTGLSNLPPDLEILLIDRELLRNVDLRAQGTYSFYLGHRGFITDEAAARFQLLVGSADFIAEHTDDLPDQPARTALYQNRPNPFNPSTVIRYDIAQAGKASLRIYDISGALVKTLLTEHHAPGRYEVVWRGDDEHGQRVASGVYFIQLEGSTGHRQTRKTLLMK